jgi:hypothetical protein
MVCHSPWHNCEVCSPNVTLWSALLPIQNSNYAKTKWMRQSMLYTVLKSILGLSMRQPRHSECITDVRWGSIPLVRLCEQTNFSLLVSTQHSWATSTPSLWILWCSIFSTRTVGPYFFEDDVERAEIVNTEGYKVMSENFLVKKLHECELPVQFQQDGATAHTAWISMAVLGQVFPQWLISHYRDINWSPSSPDLSADFFFCGVRPKCVRHSLPLSLT